MDTDPFAAALEVLHASVLAAAADYHSQATGQTVSIRVIRDQGTHRAEAGDRSYLIDGDAVSIRRQDVARPQVGDTLLIDGDLFSVCSEPLLDAEALSWLVSIRSA